MLQHGMHDDGEFASNGDRRPLEAKAVAQLKPPGF